MLYDIEREGRRDKDKDFLTEGKKYEQKYYVSKQYYYQYTYRIFLPIVTHFCIYILNNSFSQTFKLLIYGFAFGQ